MTLLHKAYRLHEQPPSSKKLSKGGLHTPAPSEVEHLYQQYLRGECLKKQTRLLWRLLKLCNRNSECQSTLAKILKIPFERGPMSINELPIHLLCHDHPIQRGLDETSQLEFLFEYLKNVRDSYLCWILYFNEELAVLNIKLLREDELTDYEDLFDPSINLIGLFLQPSLPLPRPRALSPFFSPARTTSHYAKVSPEHSTGNSWKTSTTKERQGSKCEWKRAIKKRVPPKKMSPDHYFDF